MAQKSDKAQAHAIHTDASGRLAWVNGQGLHRLPQPLDGEARMGVLADVGAMPFDQAVPVGRVVLRCKCGDPTSHVEQGEHCPEAEVDFAETMLGMLDD